MVTTAVHRETGPCRESGKVKEKTKSHGQTKKSYYQIYCSKQVETRLCSFAGGIGYQFNAGQRGKGC